MTIQITLQNSRKAVRELTTRANQPHPHRLAAEFVSRLKRGKQMSHTSIHAIRTLPMTSEEIAAMTDEERIQNYMDHLGEPLTIEQWKAREAEIKELEKLPIDEIYRRYPAFKNAPK